MQQRPRLVLLPFIILFGAITRAFQAACANLSSGVYKTGRRARRTIRTHRNPPWCTAPTWLRGRVDRGSRTRRQKRIWDSRLWTMFLVTLLGTTFLRATSSSPRHLEVNSATRNRSTSLRPLGILLSHQTQSLIHRLLILITRVNGEVKQETSTCDMIWGVRQIISHLSRGTTLRKGTVIMTGTPSGVGFFRKEFLKNADIVEVELKGMAKVRNEMRYV